MKRFLRIVYAKVFIILSFQAYAQNDVRSYDNSSKQKEQTAKGHPVAQVRSSEEKATGKTRNVVPDIRREVAEESISLYPNPVVDQLLVDVDLNQWQGGTIMIKSRSGRKIAQQRITDASTGFNLASVNRGVYLLTIRKGGSERTIEVVKL